MFCGASHWPQRLPPQVLEEAAEEAAELRQLPRLSVDAAASLWRKQRLIS
jgi:hypothetical protein